jgi:valyl-tRNA synthetase
MGMLGSSLGWLESMRERLGSKMGRLGCKMDWWESSLVR